jgi:probable rRNA maturation factor
MNIEIRVKAKFSSRVARARLTRVARKTLRVEKANAALTIYVTDDAEIHKMNRAFHGTDAPTDVLAFPLRMEGRLMWGRLIKRPYLGDIIISYDRARVQARVAGWRISDELELLAVHGILHLLGYDDVTPRKRAEMWKRQEEILGRTIDE